MLTTEFRVRSEDGFRTVSCRGSSFLGDGGMRRMIGMEIDVTQEHQTKDELTRLYSLLSDETATIRRARERIFEMTADLMTDGKADGPLLTGNPAGSKALGFSESHMRDIYFRALFSEKEA